MRNGLIILFSLFSMTTWSQSPPITTTKLTTTRQLVLPQDTLVITTSDSGSLAFKGDTLYKAKPRVGFTTCRWVAVGYVGSTIGNWGTGIKVFSPSGDMTLARTFGSSRTILSDTLPTGEIIHNLNSDTLTRNMAARPLVIDDNKLRFRSQIVDSFVTKEYLKTWLPSYTPLASIWVNVTWSPDQKLLVAVSHSGTSPQSVMSSPDGITWTVRNAPNSNEWRGVAYSPELKLFVAVGSSGTGNRAMSSPDGITWTSRTSTGDYKWRNVIWVSQLGLFIAIANTPGFTDKVMTSPDGINWISRTCPDKEWSDIAYSPELNILVATATAGTAGQKVMTSIDGINWTLRASANDAASWEGLGYSSDLKMFVAVDFAPSGAGTAGKRVMTSPDGITWTLRNTPADNSWLDVDWSPELGAFAAVASGGTGDNNIMTSTDGINWNTQPSTLRNWRRIKWVKELGSFVSVAFTEGSFLSDSLVMMSRPIDVNQQYLATNGRFGGQTVLGKVDFKNMILFRKSITIYDSVSQVGASPLNTFEGKTYYGTRSVEGNIINFFASATNRVYREETTLTNPLLTSTFGTFQYFYLPTGASMSKNDNIYSSSVLRLKGAATINNATGPITANKYDFLFTAAPDYSGALSITGPTDPSRAISVSQSRIGATNGVAINMSGWYSSYISWLQLNSAGHIMDNYADYIAGTTTRDNTATLAAHYGFYILPLKQSWVGKAYAIYQSGTADTNYLAGIVKTPNLSLQADTSFVTVDQDGVEHKRGYSSIVGPGDYLNEGSYTPTLTNGTNVTSSTSDVCSYIKVGNKVIYSGRLSVTLTSTNTNSVLSISLPIASSFTLTTDCHGPVSSIVSGMSGGGEANTSTGQIDLKFIPSTLSGVMTIDFQLTYLIK